MKKLLLLSLALAVALIGCGRQDQEVEVESTKVSAPVQSLSIEWQRMVDEDGNACCGSQSTRQALQDACARLTEALAADSIEVVFKETMFSPQECVDAPERANRILVAGLPVEHWLKAEAGTSPCQGFCKQALGDEGSCRTLIYQGQTYEVIPADLIVRAGLVATSHWGDGHPCEGCPGQAVCTGRQRTCDGSSQGPCGAPGGGKQPGHVEAASSGHSAASSKPACPNASQCQGKTCPLGG
jgi:hypothetical protein